MTDFPSQPGTPVPALPHGPGIRGLRHLEQRLRHLSLALLIVFVAMFLVLGAYQLSLPGLHYDEAKEAGLNAMQLVTGQPVTAFRDAVLRIGPWRLPLMVQDYIGALNVFLAMPFLALGGINTVALRWLSLIIGAVTLLLAWRIADRLGGPIAAIVAAGLLAVNPSFIFWSRQGVFVTNLAALIFMASLLTGLRWWRVRRPRDLWLTAFLLGLGVYAKLLFVWAIGAVVVVALLAPRVGLGGRRSGGARERANGGTGERGSNETRTMSHFSRSTSPLKTWLIAAVFFLLPLIPLILFNIQTGGTLLSIFGNLDRSYYGVSNAAFLSNLLFRLGQLRTLLRGDHFWYLGELFADPWAPWLAGGLILLACLLEAVWLFALDAPRRARDLRPGGPGVRPRLPAAQKGSSLPALGSPAVEESLVAVNSLSTRAREKSAVAQGPGTTKHGIPCPTRFVFLLPVALVLLIVAQSAFTVSDLFITHYALLLPLIPIAAGLAAAALFRAFSLRKGRLPAVAALLAALAVLWWGAADLSTTIRYHVALSQSGGYSGHSDAIYRLATYLDSRGYSAPLALDWGLDAPTRFLTAGRVNPVEVFGYERFDEPDAGFPDRMKVFLANPDNVYLAHMPDATVFRGRLDALQKLAAERGLTLPEEARFTDRSGQPLFFVYRAVHKPAEE